MHAKLMRNSRLPWLAAAAAVAVVTVYLTVGGTPAAPARSAPADTAVHAPLSCGPPDFFIPCYSPGEYQVAYGVAPLLRSGITGSGETVVMPELAPAPGANYTDIRRDLAAFDAKFGLPAASSRSRPRSPGQVRLMSRPPRRSRTPRWCTRSRPAPPSTWSWSLRTPCPARPNFTAAVTGLVRTAIAQNAAVISISGSKGETFFTRAEVAQDPRGSAAGFRSPCHGRRVVRGHRRDQRQRPA